MPDENQKPKIFISLVAQIGAGKDEFVKTVKDHIGGATSLTTIRFSDPLFAICSEFEISPTRENLQKISAFLDRKFPRGRLTAAIKNRALAADADIVILNGVRWPSDEEMVRSLPHHIMVYITAHERIRYERRRQSPEKPDEATMSFEEFQAKNQAITETSIPDIGSRADVVIENNGTLQEFQARVVDLLYRILGYSSGAGD